MRRYWRAQRRARKGNRRTEEEERRSTLKVEKRGEDGGTKSKDQRAKSEIRYLGPVRRSEETIKKNVSSRNNTKDELPRAPSLCDTGRVKNGCNIPVRGAEGGLSRNFFGKDQLPDIDCRDIAFLSDTSNESFEEDIKEEEKENEIEEKEQPAEELKRPLFLITEETAKLVGSGVSKLEMETCRMGSEMERLEDRVRKIQERVVRLERRRKK